MDKQQQEQHPMAQLINSFDLYAAWTDSVAQYPLTAEPFYLGLGIADEMGEFEAEHMPAQMLAEGGDVLWYCARYATRVLKVDFGDVIVAAVSVNEAADVVVATQVGIICGVEKKRIRDGEQWDDAKRAEKQHTATQALIKVVAYVASRLAEHGITLRKAADYNMCKLGARLSAGTIKGDGGER